MQFMSSQIPLPSFSEVIRTLKLVDFIPKNFFTLFYLLYSKVVCDVVWHGFEL